MQIRAEVDVRVRQPLKLVLFGILTFAFLRWYCPQETGRYVWKNVATGEVCQILTSAMKEQMRMADDLAKQKESLRAKRAARKR